MENSNYVFDKKDAAYYKNTFLNNSKMLQRYADKILYHINAIKQLESNIEELKFSRNPNFCDLSSYLLDFKSQLESMEKTMENLKEKSIEEFEELCCFDFQAHLDKQKQLIQELENKSEYQESSAE